MLHRAVLAGVWDHSNFRNDMHLRLRRTARFISLTTFGGREEANAAIARVRGIHDRVRGVVPDGGAFEANDPALLARVQVTETTRFLKAWMRYAEPDMPAADQDRYFAEMIRVAEPLGADPIPRTKTEAQTLIETVRPHLLCDARTREVARLVMTQRAPHLMVETKHALTMQAGVDLLPDWARGMLGLSSPLWRIKRIDIPNFVRYDFVTMSQGIWFSLLDRDGDKACTESSDAPWCGASPSSASKSGTSGRTRPTAIGRTLSTSEQERQS